MNRIILLVAPEFPPSNAIGARRWAKFAKYLAKDGVLIKVVAFVSENKSVDNNWMKDISHPNIEVFYLPSRYPKLLKSTSQNLSIRIMKKIVSLFWATFFGGIIQDRTIFFKKTFDKKAIELIEKFSIKNVICSGPYHRACYYSVLLKRKFSAINVIVDFRDRWTDGEVYGINKLSARDYAIEEAMQKYTCENADYIISTYQEIIKELKVLYSHINEDKFVHFPHNYDLDDYPNLSNFQSQRVKGKIKLIYGGTINTVAFNDAFKPFLIELKKIQLTNRDLYDSIEISIYGENYQLTEFVKSLELNCVKCSSKIQEKEFYEEVAKSDFLLLFLGNNWKDLITTKNITYLPFNKPMIVVSQEGVVSKMITENNLGYLIEPTNTSDKLSSLLSDFLAGKLTHESNFNYQEYSYERATDRMLSLLKF